MLNAVDNNDENVRTDSRADTLVMELLRVRKRRAQRAEIYKRYDEPEKEREQILEGKLFEFLDRIAAKSVRVTNGTLITSTSSTSASLADKDAFMRHVIGSGQFELLERRANAQACLDFANENGELPPGVKINTRRILRVTE